MDNKIPAKDLHSFITRYIPPPYNKKRQTAPSTLIWSSPLTPENMDIAQATVRGHQCVPMAAISDC